jgi:hypothetical protein
MNVRTQSDVIGKIPTVVVGIVVNHDLVAVPQPVIAKGDVVGSDAKVESAEPKARRTAAFDPVHMATTDSPAEASMFPGMIKMLVSIVAAGVMSDPFPVGVNVRGFGMTRLVGVRLVFRLRM